MNVHLQAHIAAKQAGYRPMEINASDDRSGKTIRERLADAQAMRSVFGEYKHVCGVWVNLVLLGCILSALHSRVCVSSSHYIASSHFTTLRSLQVTRSPL